MGSTRARHAFGLAVGLLYAWLVFGVEACHFLATSVVTWVLLRVLPREGVRVGGARVLPHHVVYALCMSYLLAGHIWTTYYHYMQFALNWTASQVQQQQRRR